MPTIDPVQSLAVVAGASSPSLSGRVAGDTGDRGRRLRRSGRRILARLLSRRWRGSRGTLEAAVGRHLATRPRSFLQRLVRDRRFAVGAAAALLASWSAFTAPPIQLSDVAAGIGGFVFEGTRPYDFVGWSVSDAGDVNGDGLDDLVVGAFGVRDFPYSSDGRGYVIFGKADGNPVLASDLDAGVGGFALLPVAQGDALGWSVSGAGDVNGDGLADVLVNAPYADRGYDTSVGESYVLFGKTDTAPVLATDLQAGIGGFTIRGSSHGDSAGMSLSRAGDVNGDGLDDLLIGGAGSAGFCAGAGGSYVVFGKSDGTLVELADVAMGTGGFAIPAIDPYTCAGHSVSDAGDVNGDGLDDVIVSSPLRGTAYQGECHVVFGKPDGLPVDLTAVAAGSGGFVITGRNAYDVIGIVSSAGDVNGDGLDDVVIGAQGADPNGVPFAGEASVVFGKSDGTPVALADVAAGNGGFLITGVDPYDLVGCSVSGAGDLNGDGLDDLLLGSEPASFGPSQDGGAYVVFGKADGTTIDLAMLASSNQGFQIVATDLLSGTGSSVSGAGDVNGDSRADFILGAPRAEPQPPTFADRFYGKAYIVFGPDLATPLDSDGDGLTDAQELALANGGPCPDLANPDSDADSLTDGEEELVLGTDPCDADTDDDGVADASDPTPTEPGVPVAFLESFLRDISSRVIVLDLALFQANNPVAALKRRGTLAFGLRRAAADVAAGNSVGAIATLESMLPRLDDQPAPGDWMVASPEKTALRADIELAIALLELLP